MLVRDGFLNLYLESPKALALRAGHRAAELSYTTGRFYRLVGRYALAVYVVKTHEQVIKSVNEYGLPTACSAEPVTD